ncbi:MAG: GGDEF domain-containing protein [Burkholderiaceae bacterium]|nr:GGDEF domain-containing protein [Burkholderiaceae bacterium]
MARARQIEQTLHRQQLSEQSARLRLQFNRDRDTQELGNLRALNEQGQRLRRTQALALGLFVLLLAVAVALVIRKVRQARRLNALASTDELTGLTNRRALLAFAGQALAQARAAQQPLGIVMTDVDHFKRINDTHGHAVGDEVLRHVAGVLGASLRAQDRLGRVGGEEFVGVLPRAGLAAARAVGERMRAAVESTPALSATAGRLPFTVSVGVAVSTGGESLEALIARADAALYRAKREGRNRVCTDGSDADAP